MVAGASWIGRSPVGPTAQIVLLTVMLVVAQFPLWFPILVHAVAPSRMERIQGLTDRSIQHIGGRTCATIVLAIGALLMLSGLTWVF